MATAGELQAQIAARVEELRAAQGRSRSAKLAVNDAEERQRLRRALDDANHMLEEENRTAHRLQVFRQNIDFDFLGPHTGSNRKATSNRINEDNAVQFYCDCTVGIDSGELEWSVKGFSWLREGLKQQGLARAASTCLEVAGHGFTLVYDPDKGNTGNDTKRGSLAFLHYEHPEYEGVAFRYTMWIKTRGRGFVQWGESDNICITDSSTDGIIFGPDVCIPPATPAGIFGMSHADLVKSEFVVDDVLTVKLKVEVRQNVPFEEDEGKLSTPIVVPPSTLGEKLLFLLDGDFASDVTFMVQGEEIRAHSQILAACSEVLRRQFACGMQESRSKHVIVEDTDPMVFRAFLRYLYADSTTTLEDFVSEKDTGQASVDASSSRAADNAPICNRTKMAKLQQLLAISHKYQLTRMQLWCERELCCYISIADVCAVLCQAHLYEATRLEGRCLDFIKANMKEVAMTDSFGSLSQDWPQVSLKITLHVAGVDKGDAAAALGKQENARKRKRSD